MPRAPLRMTPATLAVALALSGCGAERTPVLNVSAPLAPQGTRSAAIPAAGMSFTAPANWTPVEPRDPLLGGIESRRATLAVWRYPREEPLPRGAAELRRVRDLLVERVEARDATFRLERARVTRRGGAPAVELTGEQTIAGRPVRVRSAHVYTRGAELVLDAYAPPEDFARVDATVFDPALDSLELGAPA